MISYYYRSTKDTSIVKTTAPKKGMWIFSHDIDGDDFENLVGLGFDRDLLEDANDYFEVPRFEYEDGVNYLFTRYIVDSKDGELSTAPLLIALSDDYILTLSVRQADFLKEIVDGRLADVATTQKNKMTLKILEVMVLQYNRSIMKIRRQMLRYFSNVGNISEKDMKHFVGMESTLADYTSALSATNTALTSMILRRKTLTLHEEDIDLLQDLKQDIDQLLESSKTVSKTIQNIRSAHSSIMAHKLNMTMKTLTMVTIVLTIPMVITSIFGMNTWLPVGNGPVSFFIIILCVMVMSFLMMYWMNKSQSK